MNYKLITQLFLTPNSYLQNTEDYYREMEKILHKCILQNMPTVIVL